MDDSWIHLYKQQYIHLENVEHNVEHAFYKVNQVFFPLWIIKETAFISIEATHKAKSTLLIIQSKNHNTQKQMIIIYPSIAIFSLCLGLSLCNFNHNTVYLKKSNRKKSIEPIRKIKNHIKVCLHIQNTK